MKPLLVALGFAAAVLPFRALAAPAVFESDPTPIGEVVQRFLRSAGPPLVSYRARRTLTAAALGGRVSGSVVADTSLDANGVFRFEIVREEGSSVVRERVLKSALRAEQQSHAEHEIENVALTPRNYDFQIGTEPALRFEGSPATMPSFWTRQVNVVCEYSRIDGVRVTVGIHSRADVRLVGDSVFTMNDEYTMINGRPVASADRGTI